MAVSLHTMKELPPTQSCETEKKDKTGQFAQGIDAVMKLQQAQLEQQQALFKQQAADLRRVQEDTRQQTEIVLHQVQQTLAQQQSQQRPKQEALPPPPRLPELPMFKWEQRSYYQLWEMMLRAKIRSDCSIGYTPELQILYAVFRMDMAASEFVMPWLQAHVFDRADITVTLDDFISHMRMLFARYHSPR